MPAQSIDNRLKTEYSKGIRKTKTQILKYGLLTILSLLSFEYGFSCSGYKITIGNKTLFGSNEDAWRVTPHIWFENKTDKDSYGAVFTGSRFDGSNGYAPQSGMNEMGLAFERLASHTPENKSNLATGKREITNPTFYLKDILHNCATVEEVKAFISQYNYSFFLEDVFLYIDKSGKYLVVEPYTLKIGNEPTYAISNFCPSVTKESDALKYTRYRNGLEYLKNRKIDTTLSFCKALSDTMSVCRAKIGDGTLLTTIWDLTNGTVNLYFYHTYDSSVQFNLKGELAKGNHVLSIVSMFPANKEFERMANYKTPKNNMFVMVLLMAFACLFFFTSLFFFFSYFKTRKKSMYAYIQLAMVPFGIVLFFYMVILCIKGYIFYFPSPYVDQQNIFVSISSYIPFLLLILILPFLLMMRKIFAENKWRLFAKYLFALNNLVYMILLGMFFYWGLYDIFSG